ncbi:helix-turn-helix transcriptional regulator [Bifidobacterium simiarum]|uniref:helix-turn-helix transcriptional regulator n=1 Tax=Bifidobacterium simiarum TaxID=2045441 RepID=UPI001BDCA9EA|nr:helix-turn-helix transcriptional regulator [Bifidobacterium simiarum]MBT1166228.1 helix-turn-helix transcriptional regulator [Bifidobacterium simiarum]
MSLRELRLKRGMTQQQLADKVEGMSRGRIAAYENGQRPITGMSLDVALRFCDALKISNPRKLLDEPPDKR